jgi:hypothetical protein
MEDRKIKQSCLGVRHKELKDRMKDEYDGNIMYSHMKMEKYNLLKLFQELREGE